MLLEAEAYAQINALHKKQTSYQKEEEDTLLS